jgi:putative ABC transport system ATP-binding protein
MTEVLRMSGISQSYRQGATEVTALDDVTLSLSSGELVAIMGPSGSGKSTLLGIAGALERPAAGEVVVAGTSLTGLGAKELARVRRQSIGFVFQQYNLIPLLTVRENVALPLELDGWARARAAEAVTLALAELGLSAEADLYPELLSGGQQQRAAIARAIAGTPRLVLADEPTGAVDSVTGESVTRMLRARVDAGAAAIVVTHDVRLAAWADRVYSLDDGRLHELVGQQS